MVRRAVPTVELPDLEKQKTTIAELPDLELLKTTIAELPDVELLKTTIAELRTQLTRAHQTAERERRAVRELRRDMAALIR